MKDIEYIQKENTLYGLLVRYNIRSDSGTQFVTKANESLQLGIITRNAATDIAPHVHAEIERKTMGTKECIIVQKGKIEVDFYSSSGLLVETVGLSTGDALLLVYGGHGIRFLEDSQLLEVKQGPFVATEKTFFDVH